MSIITQILQFCINNRCKQCRFYNGVRCIMRVKNGKAVSEINYREEQK